MRHGYYGEGDLLGDMYFRESEAYGLYELPVLEAGFMQSGDWRIFYRPFKETEKFGFMAYAVTLGSFPSTSEPFAHDTEINDFIRITAYFDGVRHLEVNRNDNDGGYIYYPTDLTALFDNINTLCEKYCVEFDRL